MTRLPVRPVSLQDLRRIAETLAALRGRTVGGATINMVAYHQAHDFIETMARQYEQRTGRKMKPMVCQIVDGAG